MSDSDTLTPSQGQQLVHLARYTLLTRIGKQSLDLPPLEDRLHQQGASFVTLTKGGALRGCIGTAEAYQPLVDDVQKNAFYAATGDPRFPTVTSRELAEIRIEISVLTPPRLLDCRPGERPDRVRPEVDGMLLTSNFYRGLLLPQVWEKIPDPEEFLSILCQKAGLSPSAWRRPDTQLYTFQVQAFHEE